MTNIEKTAFLKTIVDIAASDSVISDSEKQAFIEYGKSLGVKPEDLYEILYHVEDINLKETLKVITNKTTKIKLVTELITFCYADGNYTQSERRGVEIVCIQLGISDAMRHDIQKKVEQNINSDKKFNNLGEMHRILKLQKANNKAISTGLSNLEQKEIKNDGYASGAYVKNKKDMNFQSQGALKSIITVLDEADIALKDKSRTIKESNINEALIGALGAGVGAGIGFAGLFFGGSVVGFSAAGITSGLAAAGAIVGGGMTAGLAVVAAPAVVLGGAGVMLAGKIRNKNLKEAKEIVYKDAVAKQNAIIEELKKEHDADQERIAYLNGLNILLTSAIKDLQHDLGVNIT